MCDEEAIARSQEVMREGRYENEEQVFMSAFIPQNLFEVAHIEKDIVDLKRGNIDEIFYSALTGIDVVMRETRVDVIEDNEDDLEAEFESSDVVSE